MTISTLAHDAMLIAIEQVAGTRSRLKMRELARSCGWLATVLRQQDRLMEHLDSLSRCHDATSWMRQWAALDQAAEEHLRVEEAILAPAIQAMGQRAHAVVAEVRRDQIRRGLADLRWPSWEDDGARLQQLSLNIASHFAQEECWSYQALVRHQDDATNASLTVRCRAAIADTQREVTDPPRRREQAV